jgi:hypothetical protein
LANKQAQEYLQMMQDLNKPRGMGVDVGLDTRLHQGQIDALSCLYTDSEVLTLFLACGRKFGKTEAVGYILWKHALENPGAACYYIGPQKDHARKLLWDNRRIQNFLLEDSAKYIHNIENDTMTIRFNNGSYIQILGSDNYAVANGLTPSIAVYDEFKHFRHMWHTEFSPNRAALGSKLIIIGTKARPENRNFRQYNALLNFYKDDPRGKLVTKTTFDNPINQMPAQAAAIKVEIDQLKAEDSEDVIQLEYYSKVIPGGKRAIFPMLDKDKHIISDIEMTNIISKERDNLEFYVVADPGTTKVFGVLFIAYHKYNKKVYVLDEIYEEQQKKCSTRYIYPRIEAICKMWNYSPDIISDIWDVSEDWFLGYDEASAWFANEVITNYDTAFIATQKHLKSKSEGISLIRDQLNFDMILFNEKCEKTWLDMESYARRENGDIPKEHDHTIDCLRYANSFYNYDINEAFRHIKTKDPIKQGRYRRIEDDDLDEEDWTKDIFIDFE